VYFQISSYTWFTASTDNLLWTINTVTRLQQALDIKRDYLVDLKQDNEGVDKLQ